MELYIVIDNEEEPGKCLAICSTRELAKHVQNEINQQHMFGRSTKIEIMEVITGKTQYTWHTVTTKKDTQSKT